MTDKTLLQEARDALYRMHVNGVAHTFGLRITQRGSDYVMKRHADKDGPCETCQLLTRLDAEIAKVAEPVVLDLSGAPKRMWTPDGMAEHSKGLSIHLPDLLAAIRAQLPGVEVRT